MNDYMYLFTVFIAMGAVTAAERLLPFACSSWLRKQRWVGVVGNFLRRCLIGSYLNLAA